MRRLRLRPSPLSLPLTWLVWLALLLPIGQAAAGVHAYAHLGEALERSDDGAAVHASHCDLCLTAAAAAGAALPGAAPTLPACAPAQQHIRTADAGAPAAPLALGYDSRAPPVSPL